MGEGTEYMIEQGLSGVLDSRMRVGDRATPRGHGFIRGADYADARIIVFTFTISGVPHSERLDDLISNVRTVWAPTPETDHDLLWNLIGTTYMMRGRVTRLNIEYSSKSAREGRYRATVEWRGVDPFIYEGDEQSMVVPIFDSVGGGFDLATDLPLDMTGAIGLTSNLRNEGGFDAYPVIRFQNNGPQLSWVDVFNESTGVSLRIDTPVQMGQILVVDMFGYQRGDAGPAIHIDGSSRFGDWTQPRTPSALAPGDNVVRFTTDGTDVVCRFTWRSTWL